MNTASSIKLAVPEPEYKILRNVNPYSPQPSPTLHLPQTRIDASVKRLTAVKSDVALEELSPTKHLSTQVLDSMVERLHNTSVRRKEERLRALESEFLPEVEHNAKTPDEIAAAVDRLSTKRLQRNPLGEKVRSKSQGKQAKEEQRFTAMYTKQVADRSKSREKALEKYGRTTCRTKKISPSTVLASVERLTRARE